MPSKTKRLRESLRAQKVVLVPEDFEFDRSHPLHDSVMTLAAWIMERTASIDVFRDGEFMPMSRDTLRGLLSGRYKAVVDLAEEVGLIERHHSYMEGTYPKSARLAERFRDGRFKKVTLKWSKHVDASDCITNNPDNPVESWLAGHLDSFAVADSFIASDRWTKYALDSIRRRAWSFVRDEFGYRVHTNFSRASRSIRGAVLMPHDSIAPFDSDDCELYEIDIKNSQPLVIGFLASRWWLSRGCSVPLDVMRWIDVCENGLLYEDLAEKAKRGRAESTFDRQWVKDHLMTAHYAEQHVVENCYLAQVERIWYPSIWEFLSWLRAQPIDGEPQALWFRSTAMQAQRVESRLVIDTACRLLMETHPDAHLLTIHDAVIVAKKHLQAASDAIMQAFETIGMRPKLNPERLADVRPKPPLSPEQRAARARRSSIKRLRYARARAEGGALASN